MSKLEAALRDLYYFRRDPRILMIESFQKEPHTYVKVAINDGKHDIIIQEIATYPFAFRGHEKEAMVAAMQNVLKKAADIIIEQTLAPVIAEFSSAPV